VTPLSKALAGVTSLFSRNVENFFTAGIARDLAVGRIGPPPPKFGCIQRKLQFLGGSAVRHITHYREHDRFGKVRERVQHDIDCKRGAIRAPGDEVEISRSAGHHTIRQSSGQRGSPPGHSARERICPQMKKCPSLTTSATSLSLRRCLITEQRRCAWFHIMASGVAVIEIADPLGRMQRGGH
jgi:hypothetical protein